MQHTQRAVWNGQPKALRELFALTNARGTRACCALWSHPFGWEVKLDVSGSLIRSQVTRSETDAEDAADEWRAAMLGEGWQ